MSRLRRPFLYDRYFFVTVCLLKTRRRLHEPDFERLAYALARMRRKHGFLLTAWVFLPTIGTRLSTLPIRSPFHASFGL